MDLNNQYIKRKEELIKSVSPSNKRLFNKFFEWEEKKLKRTNKLPEIDERSYKTLLLYIHYFKNLDKWFNKKDWNKLTKKDIEKVYEDLEENRILKSNGEPVKDKTSYYNKVLKSKPFSLAGKKALAEEVIEFTSKQEEPVRFITEEDFKQIVKVVELKFKLMFWLCWDIGENIGSILELRKRNFTRKMCYIDKENQEPEYHINLNKEILKRSRTPRTEITNYQETLELLDIVLRDLKDEDKLFNFGLRYAEEIMKKVVTKTNIKCSPMGQTPTLKDLRSGMACHLLGERGYSSDEVKSRLGHKPSSRAIDKYINYLALNKTKPKRKVYESKIKQLETELKEIKERNQFSNMKIKKLNEKIDNLQDNFIKGFEKVFEPILEADRKGLIKYDKKEMAKMVDVKMKEAEKLLTPTPS